TTTRSSPAFVSASRAADTRSTPPTASTTGRTSSSRAHGTPPLATSAASTSSASIRTRPAPRCRTTWPGPCSSGRAGHRGPAAAAETGTSPDRLGLDVGGFLVAPPPLGHGGGVGAGGGGRGLLGAVAFGPGFGGGGAPTAPPGAR